MGQLVLAHFWWNRSIKTKFTVKMYPRILVDRGDGLLIASSLSKGAESDDDTIPKYVPEWLADDLERRGILTKRYCLDLTHSEKVARFNVEFHDSKLDNTTIIKINDFYLIKSSGEKPYFGPKPRRTTNEPCVELKLSRAGHADSLYPEPCERDIPCHCQYLTYQEPRFLEAICNKKQIDGDCIFYPFCDHLSRSR